MKALVLLSGGVDSTTCLAVAKEKYSDLIALALYYGQKHSKELAAAKNRAAAAEPVSTEKRPLRQTECRTP